MKKLIAILLALALMVTLCACGGDTPDTGDDNRNTTKAPTTTSTTENPDAEDTIKKADDETITQIEALISNFKYEDAYKMVGSIKNADEQKKWYDKFTLIEDVLLSQHGECAPDALGNPGKIGSVYYAYNSKGQMIKAILEGDFIYTDLRTIMMQDIQVVNYLLDYEEYTYNQNGQLETVTGYKDASKERKRYVATFLYNDVGLNTKVEYILDDGYKEETSFVYDKQGRLSGITYYHHGGCDAGHSGVIGNATDPVTYDDNGCRIYPNAQASYDEKGRILKTTDSDGTVTTYTYGTAYAFEE